MASSLLRVAHRGGSHLAPENTLAAFRNALTLPVDAIELDVQMSRDGQAIVFHDHTVERLTDGNGNILDLDFAYLRSLNAAAHFAGGWPEVEQIPTLREVLSLARGRVKALIELKPSQRDGVYGRYPRIAETVVQEIRRQHMINQVLVMSFDWELITRVRYIEPTLRTVALVSRELWKPEYGETPSLLTEQVKALGSNWINMDARLFSPDIAIAFHKYGCKVGLWTVNTLEELQHCSAAGVDALTSDRPDLFARLLA